LRLATCHPDRKHEALGLCRECYLRGYSRSYRGRNRPQLNARSREWHRNHPDHQHRKRAPITPSCHPDRRYKAKGLCDLCYGAGIKQAARSDPEKRVKINAQQREWRTVKGKTPEIRLKRRAKKMRRKYGLTLEQIEQKAIAQRGVCAICLIGKAECVDHDHITNKVRSLLCRTCNTGLGMFRDDSRVVKKASEYLEFWSLI
jgi:hypothetical protein